MAGGTTTLLYEFLGIDRGAGAQFDRMATKTTMLGRASSATLVKARALSKGFLVAGAVIGVASIKMAGDFQTSMLRIQTQAGGSAKEVHQLSKGVLAMAGSVASTPASLADAAYHIASVGQHSFTASQQLHILRIAAEGAKIGGANLTDVTNALDAALVAHVRGVHNYSQAMGVLNSTVGTGDMSMQDLADAFGPLGSTFKGFNVSIQQAGAALAVFGDNNIRGADAGSKLRQTVTALADPLSAGRSQLEAWGLKTGDLTKQLKSGGLPAALDVLAKKLHGAGYTAKTMGPILAEMFGKRGPQQGLSTLINQLGRFHDKLHDTTKGGSNFASSWKAYTKSFGYAWDSAKGSAEALIITLGTQLLPVATKVMNWISKQAIPALEGMAHWLKENQRWTKPLGLALGGLALALAAPAVAIAAVGVGLVVLYNKSARFREVTKTVVADVVAAWNSLRNAAMAVWGAIDAVWQAFANGPLAYVRARVADFTTFWRTHSQEIHTVTRVVWKAISQVIRNGIRIIHTIVEPGLIAMRIAFKVAWDAAKVIVVGAFRLIGIVLKTFVRTALDFVGLVLDLITGHWGKAWHDAWKLVSDAFHGIYQIFDNLVSTAGTLLYNAGVDIIKGLIGGMGSMFHSVKNTLGGLAHDIVSWKGPPAKDKVLLTAAGKLIVQGLINGMMSLRVNVKRTAQLLGIGLVTGWKDGTATLKDALTTPVQKALDQLHNVVQNAVDKQAALLKKAHSNLTQLKKSLKSDIGSLQQTIGATDLSSIIGMQASSGNIGIDYSGTTAVNVAADSTKTVNGNVNTYLAQQASQIKHFAKDLQWGSKHGLAPVLLAQIANMGAEQGDQILRQFITGQASISGANASQKVISTYSRSAATTVEDRVYANRMAADRKAVKDNSKALHDLTKALHRVEHVTARRLSTHVTIDAKTGKPKVDDQFIKDVIKGIKKAERVAGQKLL